MSTITRRKIASGILDFYFISVSILTLTITAVKFTSIRLDIKYGLLLTFLSVAISAVYQSMSNQVKFISLGELTFGIKKSNNKIHLSQYGLIELLNAIGIFSIIIPISEILDNQLDTINETSNLTPLYMLITLGFYSTYNYLRFKGNKNIILLIGLGILINWFFNGKFNLGINWSSFPTFLWISILVYSNFTNKKTEQN
ncbi:hypothetical protein V6R21_23395 [Limibacter armeniacum]|uniref:hypothetical protein n=1 Tax=Limibacter armeniacum TaxID=466084 RepID=UPI002FE633A6